MRRVLMSAFNKTGVPEFARCAHNLGFEVLASGGTYQAITKANVPAIDLGTIGRGPEFDHRVVTLQFEVHASILAKRTAAHEARLVALGLTRIDVIYVNLYPLEKAIADMLPPEQVIETIDVGGGALLIAGAKAHCVTVCDQADLRPTLVYLAAGEPNLEHVRRQLAAKALWTVGEYYAQAAMYLRNLCFDSPEQQGELDKIEWPV